MAPVHRTKEKGRPPLQGSGQRPRPLLVRLATALFLPLLSPALFADGPGNVLVLVADDMGFEMIGAYGVGGDPATTPVLDSMSQSGVLFRNAWSSPLCTPTRATIQTGRYGFRTSIGLVEWHDPVALPLAEITIPEMLDLGTGNAYQHSAFGKWHLGARQQPGWNLSPNAAGYDHYAGALTNFEGSETFSNFPKVINGVESTSTTYATTDEVDDAIAWISAASEPWFCLVNFHAPHSPFHAPPDSLLSQATRNELQAAGPVDDDPRPYFKAMCEAIDTEVGRLRSELGSVWDNATVIFLSDNGTPAGPVPAPPVEPDKAKGTLFRGGINVPLIVNSPLVQSPGSESNAFVHTADLFATIAELAEVDLTAVIPEGRNLDSVSFVPSIVDSSVAGARQELFSERFFPNVRGGPDPKRRKVWFEDEGNAGPGQARLSLEGNMVWAPQNAELVVEGAPANQTAWLVRSARKDPTPSFGGVIVPSPIFDWQMFTTDGDGNLRIPATRAATQWSAFVQVLIKDLSQPQRWQITNALRVDYPEFSRTIRDERYQVISKKFGGGDQFYDLQNDPWQNNNLLDGTLSPVEQERYETLVARLDELKLAGRARPLSLDNGAVPETR